MAPDNPHRFPDTRVTLLKRSLNAADPKSLDALDELCRLYEPPVLAWLRAHVSDKQAVNDLGQSFFEKVLRHEAFAAALEPGVSLRAVLLGGYVSTTLTTSVRFTAADRIGWTPWILLMRPDREKIEPTDTHTGDKEFHNQWRLTMLEMAVKSEREKRCAKE